MDFGTGDGVFAYRIAKERPNTLVIGTDANPDGLWAISQRAARKPSRGGLVNLLFGRLSLQDAPGELIHIADAVTVLFPWGTLLQALAVPEAEALRKIAFIGKPGARVRFLFGYGTGKEARTMRELKLPPLEDPSVLRHLELAYADAGLQVEARYASREEVSSVKSTWAKKMTFSDAARAFVELSGRVGPV